MKKWQIETSEISEILFRDFLISTFSILPKSKNWKLGFKKFGKKIPRFSRFPTLTSFRPDHYLHELKKQEVTSNIFIHCKFGYYNRHLTIYTYGI